MSTSTYHIEFRGKKRRISGIQDPYWYLFSSEIFGGWSVTVERPFSRRCKVLWPTDARVWPPARRQCSQMTWSSQQLFLIRRTLKQKVNYTRPFGRLFENTKAGDTRSQAEYTVLSSLRSISAADWGSIYRVKRHWSDKVRWNAVTTTDVSRMHISWTSGSNHR